MLRKFALILLPIALLATACGGGSSNDGIARGPAVEPIDATLDAGPDGIYGTADDNNAGDVQQFDDSVLAFEPSDVNDSSGDSSTGPASFSGGDDFVIGDDGFDGGLNDNAILGALNPLSFLGGVDVGPSSQEIDPDLGSALLNDSDVPSGFVPMGEFSFSAPSEFGDMDMAGRMFGSGSEDDDFGAMIISAVMSLPPDAMGEIDELIALTDADLAEIQGESEGFGMDFAKLEILDADGLGEAGFGMHMELDFGAFFSAFGAPEEDAGAAGIAMDMYAFVVGDRVLMMMVVWPIGEPQGVDGRSLAEIMASRS